MLLRESLAIDAEDATTALSNARQKQLAVLSRVNKRLAEVQHQLDRIGLGKRDRSWVRFKERSKNCNHSRMLQLKGRSSRTMMAFL